MSASYQIYIIDRLSGDTLLAFSPSALFTFKMDIRINAIGSISLSLPVIEDFDSIFADDNFIEIYRIFEGTMIKENTYIITFRDRIETSEGDRLMVGGSDLLRILLYRVIDPSDDPLNAGGYSIKGGQAEDVIREFIREQIADLSSVSRSISQLSVPAPTVVSGNSAGATLRFDILFDIVKGLADSNEVDVWIERTTGENLQCNIGTRGSDKSVETNIVPPYTVFDPVLGNLFDPSLQEDSSSVRNHVYVGGAGEGSNQAIVELETAGAVSTPLDRREFYVGSKTSKDIGENTSLITRGRSELVQKRLKPKFAPTLPGDSYRDEWELGDIVTIRWNDFQETLRIIGITFTFDGSRESVTPEVSLQ